MERRDFIRYSAVSAVGVGLSSLISGSHSSLFGRTAPGDKVKVALIGCRSMGWSDLSAFLTYPQVECVALCDVDDAWLSRRAADVEKATGKKVPNLYKDWRQVIDNKDVDVVINGTPDHWHCLPTIAACEAGKDVYCEKPLSNSIEECDLMVKAARRYGRIVQVGQWQRSDQHWNDAAAFVQSGKLGKVRTVKVWTYQDGKATIPKVPDGKVPDGVDYNMWLGPAPLVPFNINRFHYNFRFFWDYAGGLMSDWGVHLLDYALASMKVGLPSYVISAGGKFAYPGDAMETPDTLMTTYRYPDFTLIWDHACGINHGLYNKQHGLAFLGENGTLVLDRSGWEVIPEKVSSGLRMEAIPFQKGLNQGLKTHVGNMLDCMVSRQLPNADVAVGATVAKLTHLGNISCRLQRALTWDDPKSAFVKDKEANQLASASYRNPWKLPKV